MKKIKQLNSKEREDLYNAIKDADIISFDADAIKEKIELAYALRWSAHESLLESDLLLDEVLKELYGDKTPKKRTMGKNTKGRRLGKKV